MADVIVVFPNKDNAINIRNILTRGGCEVIGVCTTGAQVLHYTELLDEGIVVCGYKLADIPNYGNTFRRNLRCFWWRHRKNGREIIWKV